MSEPGLVEIFRQLENILKITEREPGKVDSGNELGCLKSYYETRVAQLEPELELREKEKYESIFRKYDHGEHAPLGTFCKDGRTVKIVSNNMKNNLQIQINNTKEMKIPKMIAAGYASKLRTLRTGNWKLNEFDISVNLFMHLYRPNENKWPTEDGSSKFVDGFERIVTEREIFIYAWEKGKREFDKDSGGIFEGNKCHSTLFSKNNLKEICSNQTLNNYNNKTSNQKGKPKGMIQHETVVDANICRDFNDRIKEFRENTNLDDLKSSSNARSKFHKDFRDFRTFKEKCKLSFKKLGEYTVKRDFIDIQRQYHRQTKRVATDDGAMQVTEYDIYQEGSRYF